MSDNIKLSIKLDKLQAEKDLTNFINSFNNKEMKLNIDTSNINSQLQQVSKNINRIYSTNTSRNPLEGISKNAEDSAKVFEKQLNLQDKLSRSIQDLQTKKNALNRQYGDKIDTSSIDKAISELKSMDNISMSNLNNALQNVNSEIRKSTENAKASEGILSKLGSSLGKMGIYINVGDIFRGIRSQAQEAIKYVMDVEKSMIDLRRVVDMSDTQANTFQTSMHNLSVQLASTNSDTISTVATFAKLGYSLQDATQLGEIATKYNFAADINNMNEATLSLVSTMKAYKIEAKDSAGITNDINEVSNNYAVTAQDINTILQKSASTMSTFGNSLKENIALGTVANQIMQNAESVGQGLKTIGARITTNSNALDELEAMKINIEDTNGNLKSTYQIFKEMSPLIQKMKGSELARVTNNLFGKNQISTGLAIVNNIDELDKVMATLGDTTNSVDKEFERYLDSTQAKVSQLKENMGGLYTEFLDSNMTKGTVDGLNSFVVGLTNVIGKLGTLPTVIATVVGSISLFNSKFRESMTNYQPAQITSWTNKLNVLSQTYASNREKINKNIEAQKEQVAISNTTGMSYVTSRAKLLGYQTQLGIATVKQTACAVGAKALGLAFNMALGAGIGFAVQMISEWVNHADIAKQKNEELLATMQQTSSDINTLQELNNKYLVLNSTLQNGNLTEAESASKKNELNDVYKQLIQSCPQLEGALSSENGKYEENIELIQQAIKLKQEQLKLDTQKYITDNDVNDKGIDKQISKIKELKGEIEGFSKKSLMTDAELTKSGDMTIFGKMFGSGDDRRKYFEQMKNDSKQDLIDLQSDLQTTLSKINSSKKLGIDLGVSKESEDEVKGAIREIQDILSSESGDLNTNTNATKSNEVAKQALSQASLEMSQNGEVSIDTIQALSNAFPDLGINTENVSEKLKELGLEANNSATNLEKLQNQFNGFKSTNAIIDDVIADMEKYGGITEDTYSKVIGNQEVINALKQGGDQIQNLTDLQEANRAGMQAQIDQAFGTADAVSQAYQQEADSKIDSDSQKQSSDADTNAQLQQNTADTVDNNSSNYEADDSNFAGIQGSKSSSDAGFQSGWRTNTAETINSLGDMYAVDVSNFSSAMEAKNALLGQFGKKLESISNAFAGASDGLNRTANLMGTQAFADNTGDLANSLDGLLGTGSQISDALGGYQQGLSDISKSFSDMSSKIDTTPLNVVAPNIAKVAPSMVSGSKGGSGSGGSKGGSGSSGKSDAEKQAEKEQKEAVERDKKAIEEITKAYDDADDQISNAISNIDYSLSELGDSATLKDKVEIDTSKLKLQNGLLDEAKNQLDALTNASMETEDGQEALQSAIQKANETLISQKKAVQELNTELKKLTTDAIKDMLEKQHELEKLQLEGIQQKQKDNLLSSSYGFSQDDFNKYKSSIKKGLMSDISDLQDMLEDETDLSSIQVINDAILSKQLQLNDLEKQSYDNVSDLVDMYEKIHTERENAIQSQIDAIDEELNSLDERNEAEERENTLLEKRNTLKQAELDLERLKNQKTVYSYKKQEDGTYQFEWTTDQKAIDEAKQKVDDAKKDYNDTQDSYDLEDQKKELNARKELLEKQKEYESDLVNTKKDLYDKDLENLEKSQSQASDILENKYRDMDKLANTWLTDLQSKVGDNWSTIATAITTNTDNITKSFDALTDLKANEGIEGLANAIDQSGLLGIKLTDVQEKVSINANGLQEVLKNTTVNHQAIEDANRTNASNLLSIQTQSQNNQLSAYKDFASVYSEFSDKFLELVQAIYDFRFSNMTTIAGTSLGYIMTALEQAEVAYNEFVEMMNEMHAEDEDWDNLSYKDTSDLQDKFNQYKQDVLNWYDTKSSLYDKNNNPLYNSDALANYTNGTNSLLSRTVDLNSIGNTTNNTVGGTTYKIVVSNVSLPNVKSGEDFINQMFTYAQQKTNTNK